MTRRKNTAPGPETPEDERTRPPEGDAPVEPDATDNGTGDQPAAEDKPAPRSLEWWKAKAREHQATIDTLTTERDALQARLDTVQQREVESLVSGKLHDPADVFRFGPAVAELLDEDGNVDPALVDAALAAVVAEHPHIARGYGIPPAAPASMVTSRDVPDREAKQSRTFQELLQGAGRTR